MYSTKRVVVSSAASVNAVVLIKQYQWCRYGANAVAAVDSTMNTIAA